MKKALLLITLGLAAASSTVWSQPLPNFSHPKVPAEVLEKLRAKADGECIREVGQLTGAERRDHLRQCAQTKKAAFQARIATCEREASSQPPEQRQSLIVSCLTVTGS